MPDLLQDGFAQARCGESKPRCFVDSLGKVVAFGPRFDLQASELDGIIINIHVGIGQKLPLEIISAPTDNSGPAEFIAQIADELDGEIGLCVCDPEIDFQFFNSAFHVRPFVAGSGFGSRRDPASGAKGRPAGEVVQ